MPHSEKCMSKRHRFDVNSNIFTSFPYRFNLDSTFISQWLVQAGFFSLQTCSEVLVKALK